VEVIEVIRDRNRIRLSTVCTNAAGEEVLSGEAWVLPSRVPVAYERRLPAPTFATLLWQPWTWAAETAAAWTAVSLSLFAPPPARRA
jgi:hypothetical protein